MTFDLRTLRRALVVANTPKFIFSFVIGLMIVNLISNQISVFWFRTLTGEGIPWAFFTSNFLDVSFDRTTTRYSNLILQVPAIFLGRWDLDPGYTFAITAWMYSLPWLISTFYCAWYINRSGNIALGIYPLVAFATLLQTVLPQPSFLASDVLSISWPLVLLVLLPRWNRYNIPGIAFLSAASMFSHESIITAVGTIWFLKLVDLRKFPSHTAKQDRIVVGLLSVSLIWLIWRILGPSSTDKSSFVLSLFDSRHNEWYLFRIVAFGYFGLLISLLVPKWHGRNVIKYLIIFPAFLLFLWGVYRMPVTGGWELLNGAQNARAYAIVANVPLILLFYIATRMPKYSFVHASRYKKRAAGIVTVLVLLFSLLHDIRNTLDWAKAIKLIEDRIATAAPCEEIADAEAQLLTDNSLRPQSLPQISLMLSQLRYGHVKSVLMSNANRIEGEPNGCCLIGNGKFPFYDEGYPIGFKWKFKLDKVQEYVASNRRQLGCK